MEEWDGVPEWFDLRNYDDLASYTASQWFNEIIGRWLILDVPDNKDLIRLKDQQIEHIKRTGLLSKVESAPYGGVNNAIEGLYEQKRATIREISELEAYRFYFDSDKKDEIEQDFILNEKITNEWFDSGILGECPTELRELSKKYSLPLHHLYESTAFLQIDLAASNKQIISEFSDWLSDQRQDDEKVVKRKLSKKDFQRWYDAMILAYWDLANFAKIEGATISYHILGKALFPDVYDVDVTERVRKVTKVHCDHAFSDEVIGALRAQAEAETYNVE